MTVFRERGGPDVKAPDMLFDVLALAAVVHDPHAANVVRTVTRCFSNTGGWE